MKRERVLTVIKNMDPVMETFLNQNETVGEDCYVTAHEIFRLLPSHSRGLVISAIRECLGRKSPRLKTLLSFFNREEMALPQRVSPQKTDLLDLTYTPRPLEDYDHDT